MAAIDDDLVQGKFASGHALGAAGTASASEALRPLARLAMSSKLREQYQRVFPPLLNQTPFAVHAGRLRAAQAHGKMIYTPGASAIGFALPRKSFPGPHLKCRWHQQRTA